MTGQEFIEQMAEHGHEIDLTERDDTAADDAPFDYIGNSYYVPPGEERGRWLEEAAYSIFIDALINGLVNAHKENLSGIAATEAEAVAHFAHNCGNIEQTINALKATAATALYGFM